MGVFSFRRVKFESGFHTSPYPDEKVLDFVIVFSYATLDVGSNLSPYTIQGATLINSYTLENT